MSASAFSKGDSCWLWNLHETESLWTNTAAWAGVLPVIEVQVSPLSHRNNIRSFIIMFFFISYREVKSVQFKIWATFTVHVTYWRLDKWGLSLMLLIRNYWWRFCSQIIPLLLISYLFFYSQLASLSLRFLFHKTDIKLALKLLGQSM